MVSKMVSLKQILQTITTIISILLRALLYETPMDSFNRHNEFIMVSQIGVFDFRRMYKTKYNTKSLYDSIKPWD